MEVKEEGPLSSEHATGLPQRKKRTFSPKPCLSPTTWVRRPLHSTTDQFPPSSPRPSKLTSKAARSFSTSHIIRNGSDGENPPIAAVKQPGGAIQCQAQKRTPMPLFNCSRWDVICLQICKCSNTAPGLPSEVGLCPGFSGCLPGFQSVSSALPPPVGTVRT